MEITEVRIKLMEDSDDRLQAFCSITFDNAFVIRDLKIIDGTNGPFVAMPSRKLTAHCPYCRSKNHLRAAYCNQCGRRLRDERTPRDMDGRAKLYADVAHPINPQCREMIQNRVIAEFEAELERAEQPGYVSRYDDDYETEFDDELDSVDTPPARPSLTPAESTEHAKILPPPRREEPASGPAKSAAREPSPPPRTLPPVREAGGTLPPPQAAPASAQPARSSSTGERRPSSRPARGDFGAGIFEET